MAHRPQKNEFSHEPDRHYGLSRSAERALKRRLRRSSPSEPWVEAQIVVVDDIDADGRRIHYRLHDASVFPPGKEETLMVRCSECGVYNPPNAMERGRCLDHARHKGWGRSISAKAIQALDRYRVGLEFLPLAPEDIKSLQLEIEHIKRSECKNQERVARL
jgi:hypothetical protein